MTHSAGVTWTCDRCRRQVTLEAAEHPEGWHHVKAENLGKADGVHEWEICNACYSQVERLLMDVEKPDNGWDRPA